MVIRCLPTLKRIVLVSSTVLACACAPLQPPVDQAPVTPSVDPTPNSSTSTPESTPDATPAAHWDTVLAEARAWEASLPADEPRETWVMIRQDPSPEGHVAAGGDAVLGGPVTLSSWENWTYVDSRGHVTRYLSVQYNSAGQIIQLVNANTDRSANWSLGMLVATSGPVDYIPTRGIVAELERLRSEQSEIQLEMLQTGDTPIRRYTAWIHFTEPLPASGGQPSPPDVGEIRVVDIDGNTGQWIRDEWYRVLPDDVTIMSQGT